VSACVCLAVPMTSLGCSGIVIMVRLFWFGKLSSLITLHGALVRATRLLHCARRTAIVFACPLLTIIIARVCS
jgi:hypothetical protein